MRTVQILCIAVLLCLATCDNLGGRSFLATYSNEDPGSCLLNLTYTVASNKVTFHASKYLPDPGNPDCTFQDVVSAPMWYNVPFTPVNLNFSDPSLTGVWQYSDFNQAKGKSCFLIGDFGSPVEQQWACRFKYSSVYFYLNVRLAAGNTSFDTSHTNLLFPELSAKNITRFGFTIWVPNNAFPHIIGKLEDGCGVNNWDNVINNLNTDVTVTGTEYMSNTFDLNTYLSGTAFLSAYALKIGANAANYRQIQVAGSPMRFQSPSAQQCTDMGINYNTGSLIPNLNYCDPGCSISFMLRKNPQQYLIITNGIHTPVRLLRA